MPIVALGLLSLINAPLKTWYGPAVATFHAAFGGNPYDPAQNDVKVRFTGPSGAPIERIAYFDESDCVWKAVLVTEKPGKYVAKLIRNGVEKLQAPDEGILDVSNPLPNGFVRIDPFDPRRFRWDNGDPYYPIGFNMGWHNTNDIPLPAQIDKMGKNGVNWTRIWACHWDGKNPWWPQDKADSKQDGLWSEALEQWATLVPSCEKNKVEFQMVLFHHGLFSSTVNPNWPDHPWNAKNGGFLKSAADFFVDPEAKRRSKMWLRYAVARFGHSPSIMAWELFNEVEWVDARYANRWGDIATWHSEMADYIRSIDPYQHLITTSSAVEQKDMYSKLDYLQPHIYTPNVFAGIHGTSPAIDKPMFFGEFGAEDMGKADARLVIRDGILGALLANHSGAGQFWYWDLVDHKDLYGEFSHASALIDKSDFVRHANARPVKIIASTESRGAAELAPGLGWQKSEVIYLHLPDDLALTGKLAAYIQGETGGNAAMFPGPLKLTFDAPTAGVAKILLSEASKNGTNIAWLCDGKSIGTRTYAPQAENLRLNESLEIPFGPGHHTVELRNLGGDWVKFAKVTVSGIAPEATVTGLADARWLMFRVQGTPDAKSKSIHLVGLPLSDGTHSLTQLDLDSGAFTPTSLSVSGGKATIPMVRDAVLYWNPSAP